MKHPHLILAILVWIACSYCDAEEKPWTLRFDFNDGEIGSTVRGIDAGGGTKYTAEQHYEGGKAASLEALRGKENFGRWGGRFHLPAKLRKGDELWWRVRTYWPKGMDYSANPRLKFLRIHTCDAQGKNLGYNDVYINSPGSDVPFMWIYEGDARWVSVGTKEDAIQPDQWETYEYYLKLDDVPSSEGGQARARFWKNGKLLADITDRKTLKSADAYADSALLFTYWNSSPYVGQVVCKEQTGTFKKGEIIASSLKPDATFLVEGVGEGLLLLRDPAKDWRQRKGPWAMLKEGETLTGAEGSSAVVQQVLHSHPLMDIKMFVDDVVITNRADADQDADGNPFIGVGRGSTGTR